MESVKDRKETAREKFKSKRMNLPREEVSSKSERIGDRLKRLYEFVRAENVSFYVNKEGSGEVQTKDMIRSSKDRGKKVSVPFVDGSGLKLSLIEDIESDLEPGEFGVLEPKEDYREVFPPEKLDLIVVPGVAFNHRCQRLGYGKGYYDRFLESVPSDTDVVGLAYESQVSENVPHEGCDVPVDKVVTEERVFSDLECSDF